MFRFFNHSLNCFNLYFLTIKDLLAYELPQEGGYKLSTIFAELQTLGNCLDDFSVSQTTLEQVFLKLAKEKAEGAKVEVVVV